MPDDKLKKALRKTRDPVKGGSGTGVIKKTTLRTKIQAPGQSTMSTRAKKNLVRTKKRAKKVIDAVLGYSKGGIIQHD